MAAAATTPKSVRVLINDEALQMGVQGKSLKERSETSLHSSNTSFDGEDNKDPFGVVDSIMGVNRMLEKQIEALRLRVNVEAKHHAIEKSKIIGEKDTVISKKSVEIDELKDGIQQRDEKITALQLDASNKSNVIGSKSLEIDKLRELIKQAEDYTKRLHKHSERGFTIREDQGKLKKDELNRLREELNALKQKVFTLEKELQHARDVINIQGSKISQFDEEKMGLSAKFKDQLDKANRAMRQEVERMREVMNNQWEEMRNLREQNQDIHDDVKMIRTLLVDQVSGSMDGGLGSRARTPKPASYQNDQMTKQELDKNLLKYKLEEHQQDVVGDNIESQKTQPPGNAIKNRVYMNRPTISKSPRHNVAPMKIHTTNKTSTNARSSSVMSSRNKQCIDANLPPIQNGQRATNLTTSGETGTRRPCGINSAKHSHIQKRK